MRALVALLVRQSLAVCNSFGPTPPRIVDEPKIQPDYVLFADASYEESPLASWISAILFRGAVSRPDLTNSFCIPIFPAIAHYTRTATPGDIAHSRDTSVIYGPELFTVVAAISTIRYRLRD